MQLNLIIGLIFGLIWGLLNDGVSVQKVIQTTYPGQRLVFTRNNFLLIFLFLSFIFGLIVGLFFGLLSGLIVGPIVGLFFGFFYGGYAVIPHYILRFTLARNNIIPWHIISFLDYSTDLIFLRRVGGGYIFMHRLLLEHFASRFEKNASVEIIAPDLTMSG